MTDFIEFPKMARLEQSVIPLTNGGFAFCSEEDHEALSAYRWFAVRDGNQIYAARSLGRGRLMRMHAQVFGSAGADHMNGLGVDNRRSNLRNASASQNQMNRGKFAPAHSIYKGVTWNTRDHRWTARIAVAGKRINLGSFTDEKEAAATYNRAAAAAFGEFAKLNNL